MPPSANERDVRDVLGIRVAADRPSDLFKLRVLVEPMRLGVVELAVEPMVLVAVDVALLAVVFLILRHPVVVAARVHVAERREARWALVHGAATVELVGRAAGHVAARRRRRQS